MLAARLAGAFSTLQVWVFLHHIGVKIVLPFRKACPVAQNLFGAQAVVLCQWHESQMQMGRFLVHVNHRRHDILPAYPPNKKISRPLEKGLYLLWGLALEKLRAGGYEGIYKPGAVLACPAPSLFNTALNEMVITALRLDDMEIVLAFHRVNIRVTGVLFFLSFVVGFQRPCRVALCFANRRIAYCGNLSILPPADCSGAVLGAGHTNIQPYPGQPLKVLDLWAFVCPYLSVRQRRFLSLAFFCRLCTRLAQASQYFSRLERGTKVAPHSAHRFTLALRNISASSALSCGSTAQRNHLQQTE